jgi:hypothetical protein
LGRKEVEQARDLPAVQKQTLLDFFAMLEVFVPKLTSVKIASDGGPFAGLRLNVVPVTFDRAEPRSAFEISFPSSILWAVLSCMMTFTMSIVIEQKQGTLLRLRVAPLSKMHILGGKGLACFVSCTGSAAILLVLGVTCLGVRVSHWGYLLAGIAAMAVCFSGLMMLLSVLGRTEQAVGHHDGDGDVGRRHDPADRHARLDADGEPHQPRQMGHSRPGRRHLARLQFHGNAAAVRHPSRGRSFEFHFGSAHLGATSVLSR